VSPRWGENIFEFRFLWFGKYASPPAIIRVPAGDVVWLPENVWNFFFRETAEGITAL